MDTTTQRENDHLLLGINSDNNKLQPAGDRKAQLIHNCKAVLAEFLGTLMFVFIGCGSVAASSAVNLHTAQSADVVAIAVCHGLAIMVLVFTTAKISGGHLNPVVTLSLALHRKLSVIMSVCYVIAQLSGAITGAAILRGVIPVSPNDGNLGCHELGTGVTPGMGIGMEIMLTFALVSVVQFCDVNENGIGALAPVAIGLCVLIDHLVGIPFTGASMNPARTLGPAVVEHIFANNYVYWIGPIVGSLISTIIYKIFSYHAQTAKSQ